MEKGLRRISAAKPGRCQGTGVVYGKLGACAAARRGFSGSAGVVSDGFGILTGPRYFQMRFAIAALMRGCRYRRFVCTTCVYIFARGYLVLARVTSHLLSCWRGGHGWRLLGQHLTVFR